MFVDDLIWGDVIADIIRLEFHKTEKETQNSEMLCDVSALKDPATCKVC